MIQNKRKGVKDMKNLHMVTFSLLVVGGLNWGLMGLFGFNLVTALLGAWPAMVMLVYVLVGASAVYEAAMHMKFCKMCNMKGK
jgi:uncharacterized membrane protein YuzA (DUF378 family)